MSTIFKQNKIFLNLKFNSYFFLHPWAQELFFSSLHNSWSPYWQLVLALCLKTMVSVDYFKLYFAKTDMYFLVKQF